MRPPPPRPGAALRRPEQPRLPLVSWEAQRRRRTGFYTETGRGGGFRSLLPGVFCIVCGRPGAEPRRRATTAKARSPSAAVGRWQRVLCLRERLRRQPRRPPAPPPRLPPQGGCGGRRCRAGAERQGKRRGTGLGSGGFPSRRERAGWAGRGGRHRKGTAGQTEGWLICCLKRAEGDK